MLLALILVATMQSSPSGADAPVRLEPGAPGPRLLKSPSPELPEEAVKGWLAGPVVVEYTVDVQGRVVDATALRGDAPLTEAAIAALRKWRHEPLVRDGRPTPFIRIVKVNFQPGRQFWLQERMLPEAIECLSSRYEAIRAAAAAQLGVVFKGRPASRDRHWAEKELRDLLKRETNRRVIDTAQQALAAIAEEKP